MFTGWKTKYRRDVNSQNLTSEWMQSQYKSEEVFLCDFVKLILKLYVNAKGESTKVFWKNTVQELALPVRPSVKQH